MATTAHLSVVRGDDKTYEVTVKDRNGVVVNITSYTASFTVRVQPLDTAAIFTKTLASGIALTAPTTGVLQVTLTAADTTQDLGKYHYDLQVVDTGGNILTVLRGNFKICFDVSR